MAAPQSAGKKMQCSDIGLLYTFVPHCHVQQHAAGCPGLHVTNCTAVLYFLFFQTSSPNKGNTKPLQPVSVGSDSLEVT